MNIEAAVSAVPSHRQLEWQKMEFYGFIHFGLNTMTDSEWGQGTEAPELFNPKELEADAWISLLKEAGMTGVILTCKHHDGFCLWPSRYTDYSVASAPWKNGSGDLVGEVAEACVRQGMKLGIYLSPWDRHEPSYGTGEAYDDFYVQQLTELLTGYGELFCVWLDGANGEGTTGKKQRYDWDRYYQVIRSLQPHAVISVCGPDVRWCGNEAGQTREQEWSVVPEALRDVEKIQKQSQQVDDGLFSRKVSSMDEDLGSRHALKDYRGALVWYPAEVNTSIRPGWFYHQEEDTQVRTPDELYEIYRKSVGGNGTFLLNIPPNQAGLISSSDEEVLLKLGAKIKRLQSRSLVEQAELTYSSSLVKLEIADLAEMSEDSPFWCPVAEDKQPWITLTWNKPQTISGLILQEHILCSQRVEEFVVQALTDTGWHQLVSGTTIGYKKILDFPAVSAKALKIEFKGAREYPTIAAVNVIEA